MSGIFSLAVDGRDKDIVMNYVTSSTLVYTQHPELRIQVRMSIFLHPLKPKIIPEDTYEHLRIITK
jgi:hypothetical protein